ncbi:MAG: Glutamyl-tRNA synthetase [Candidatus Carbobacillus altaicus]|uniref:Glutamate--tRNA ligase n=1 Tax=Candidatus Carbonibacillus altaicus TaxID=2163959 RepID=A0A2R6Y2V4_9BACL|nr:MAG: Glutamyl-tRNA synthetase [Candidatus Carbobacillus altaicus]
MTVRVRYAPSPTGHLHIGGARTALFNYLFARKNGGDFIVRIEDTDQKRHVAEAEASQLKNLAWLGIHWDESVDRGGPYAPYRSSERLALYHQYAQMLVDKDLAYPCFCTEAMLEEERERMRGAGLAPKYSGRCALLSPDERAARIAAGEPYALRFRVPPGKTYEIDDEIRGRVSFRSDDMGDFVIIKQDGMPTYNFAVTVDDHLMQINHVIRGEEHLSNTPRQLAIYEAFGWDPPAFAHLPLILNEDKQKMSKRDERTMQFVEQYRALGYLPEALVNFIALLGWAPPGEKELFRLDELIDLFDLSRVSKSPAVFDRQKLMWMNHHYLQKVDPAWIAEVAYPYVRERYPAVPENPSDALWSWFVRVARLYQKELSFAAELALRADLFFKVRFAPETLSAHEPPSLNGWVQEGLDVETSMRVLQAVKDALSSFAHVGQKDMADVPPEAIKDILKAQQKATGIKGKAFFMPIRLAVTGLAHGPELDQTLSLLGLSFVRARLTEALAKLTQAG